MNKEEKPSQIRTLKPYRIAFKLRVNLKKFAILKFYEKNYLSRIITSKKGPKEVAIFIFYW
jgi:hypothetical protein